MKIEIWSDYTCPFCYIGKKHLELALADYPEKEKVEIVLRSYELDPDKIPVPGETVLESLSKGKGMPVAQVEEMGRQITEMANNVNLELNFTSIIPTNTMDAHRLSHYAKTVGKEMPLADAIYKAHLVDGLDIGNHNVLTTLAVGVGLDENIVTRILAGEEYREEVRMDEKDSLLLGIRSVPFFLFNEQYAISGAQPPVAFTEALNRTYK